MGHAPSTAGQSVHHGGWHRAPLRCNLSSSRSMAGWARFRIGAAIGMDAIGMVSVVATRVMVVMAAVLAVPMVLLVSGAVVLAVCAPFLPARRRRSAMEAITALTRLAEVLRAREGR